MATAKEKIDFLGDLNGPYITLKEAAEMSDYAPDYIGQLIRAGKIEGRQVYTAVAWVTTEKAVRAYLASKGKESTIDESVVRARRVNDSMRYTLYGVITVLLLMLSVLLYIAIVGFDRRVTESYSAHFDPKTYGF